MLSNDRSQGKKERGEEAGGRGDKPPVWKDPPTVDDSETQRTSPPPSQSVILALGRQRQEDQKFKFRALGDGSAGKGTCHGCLARFDSWNPGKDEKGEIQPHEVSL